jgi:CRISPR/Cas system-associated protein Cas7 (RAMP superfamily)
LTVLKAADKGASAAKGKNAAIDKWDQETRAALAKKKAAQGAPALSKAERALVDAQLAKEAEIRARVQDALARVHEALRIIRSLLIQTSEERDHFLPAMTFSLIEAVQGKNCVLFGEEAFQTTLVSLSEFQD